jgi:hypothetical protein
MAGLLLCMLPQSLVAQTEKPKNLLMYDTEPYHFGFILAINQMSYAFSYVENYQLIAHESSEYPNTADVHYTAGAEYYTRSIDASQQPGFTVGVVGNLRLGKYFDLRLIPSLSFGTRTISYQLYKKSDLSTENFTQTKSIYSTFIEFPLHVKYKSKRLNNVAAYVIAGGNFKIDLASQKKWDIDTQSASGEQITVTDNIRVKKLDIAAEIGAGFDFYTGYFKFGIEAKMSFGLLNILDAQNLIYDSSIKNLQNRTFQLSLTFE